MIILVHRGISFPSPRNENYEKFFLIGENHKILCSRERFFEMSERRSKSLESIFLCVMSGKIAIVESNFCNSEHYVPFLAILSHLSEDFRSVVNINYRHGNFFRVFPRVEEEWELYREHYCPDGSQTDKSIRRTDFVSIFEKFRNNIKV